MAQKQKIYIPTFISSIDYKPARVLPHVYFWNGLRETDTFYVQSYASGSGNNAITATAFEQFPYFDNYNVEGGNTFPNTGSLSLLFNNEVSQYGTTPVDSLYSTYWSKYVELLYHPRTRLIDCSAIIPLADYFKMELNDIVEWRGNYYHLRAINDYNLSNGECSLQLLGPVLFDVISAIEGGTCTIDFVSEPTVTTTSTTTTSTTTTSTTTTSTTSTTTTSTTTTAAPTTTTTSTTTTVSPTGATYTFIARGGSNGGVFTYISSSGATQTQGIGVNQTGSFVCAYGQPVSMTGAGSQILSSPYTCSFTVTASYTGYTALFAAPGDSIDQAWWLASYIPVGGTQYTYRVVRPGESITVCASYPELMYFSKADYERGNQTNISIIGSCGTTTTTTLAPSSILSASMDGATSGSFTSGSETWAFISYTNSGTSAATPTLNVYSGNTTNAKLLLIGGGGAGGWDDNTVTDTGGGGGAGQVVFVNNLSISSGSYALTIGNGGAVGSAGNKGGNGAASVALGYTADWGAGGGATFPNNNGNTSTDGSGGGAAENGIGGFGGQSSGGNSNSTNAGGGGGGIGGSGTSGNSTTGGNGGAGITFVGLIDTTLSVGGGGAGSGTTASGTATAGGGTAGNAGTNGTGGGGGGSLNNNPGKGGGGRFILTYRIA